MYENPMSRYIDADETLKAMDTFDKFGYTHTGAFIRNPYTEDYVPYVHYEDMVKCVSNMPTADVQPVVRGKWIPGGDFPVRCSNCGRGSVQPENFCMTCGADMRGEDR